MRNIAVIDAETDPFKKGRTEIKPFIWGYYNADEYYEFDETSELVKFIYSRDEIIYAHNGGKFDFHFLLPYINEFQDIKIISGRIASVKIGECELRDSFLIIPMALKGYQKDDIDYAIMEKGEREKPHNNKLIRNYLRSDCRYLFELVSGFINKYGLNLTVAGTAFKIWKKEFYKGKVPTTDKEYYDDFAPYYYGGRTQAFRTGLIEKPFKIVDINSAYPTAMLDKHPIGTSYTIYDDLDLYSVERILEECRGRGGFFTLTAISNGALPLRTLDNSIYFPADMEPRKYFVTGHELKAALDNDCITVMNIEKYLEFDLFTDFKSYILHHYDARKDAKVIGDLLEDIFNKLMMNSLYGKFASNPDNYANFMNVPKDHIEIIGEESVLGDFSDFEFNGFLGDWLLAKKDLTTQEKRYYNIATSASITGWVRAFLFSSIKKCSGLIYCDTDSIAAEDTSQLEIGKELGQWDIEGSMVSGAVAGKKLYAFKHADKEGYKTASKGTRLTPAEIIKVAKGEQVLYTAEAPSFSVHKEPSLLKRTVTKTNKKVIPIEGKHD